MNFLKGKKTYIIAVLIATTTFLLHAGLINDEIYKTIIGLLGALGLSTLRAGVTSGPVEK